LLAAGESFGRYQITRKLGQGAMGAVYLAYDPQLQRYVALKTPFLGDTPRVAQRFFREARSAAQIRSPYVCPIYEVDDVGGILYLSMAFIEGRPLAKWIHENPPHPLDEIVDVFRKICSGLQKAHAHNIIHRDLKPDNIMIDSDGEPIIMDFGLARRVKDDIQVTAAGGLLGTPAYMSPEQIRGDQATIGPQSDLYSLGVVLYEMLTAKVPFQGPLMTVLHKVIHEQPTPPSSVQPNLVPNSPIETICLKMLAKDRGERYGCVGDVLAALDHLSAPEIAAPAPKRSLLKAVWQGSGRLLASLVGYTASERKQATAIGKPTPSTSEPSAPRTAPPLDSTHHVAVEATIASDHSEAVITIDVSGEPQRST
jgi:serine/threonine protein kinase